MIKLISNITESDYFTPSLFQLEFSEYPNYNDFIFGW